LNLLCLFLYLTMKSFARYIFLILTIFVLSCNDKTEDFNPQNLSNDDIKPPISNRVDYIEFEKYEQSVLLNKLKVQFQEDSITKRLWSKLIISNNSNDLLIYEPEYIAGRLIKLIDRTGSDQDIEIEYFYDSKTQKHLISKVKYFKSTNPYALSFSYSNSKLITISAIEINPQTRFELTYAYETLNVCQNFDSCTNTELQYQLTDNNNPFYYSNEFLPIFLCFSDFSDSYTNKLSEIARYLPLYNYSKLPYSYLNSKYSYNIDFEKDILYDINYRIITQNPVFLTDCNILFKYRY
jgi:hypothetical protein